MNSQPAANRRIVLARRPQGAPVADDFRMEQVAIPSVGADEVLVRAIYLSLDPYMRGRMSDAPSYLEPVAVDETMCGQTVCRVEQSNDPAFKPGDTCSPIQGGKTMPRCAVAS